MKNWYLAIIVLSVIFIFSAGVALGMGMMFTRNLTNKTPDINFSIETPMTTVPVPALFVITKTKTITEIVYPDVPSWFESSAELQEWVTANKVEDMGDKRCVAESIELWKRACRDGVAVVWRPDFAGFMQPDREWEVYCSTWIGKNLWFIDPVSGVIWEAGNSLRDIE